MRPQPVLALYLLTATALFAAGSRVGDPAPEFTLKSLDGKTISSDQLRGNIAVIHFATSW